MEIGNNEKEKKFCDIQRHFEFSRQNHTYIYAWIALVSSLLKKLNIKYLYIDRNYFRIKIQDKQYLSPQQSTQKRVRRANQRINMDNVTCPIQRK